MIKNWKKKLKQTALEESNYGTQKSQNNTKTTRYRDLKFPW